MAVVTKAEVVERLKLSPNDTRSLRITPLPMKEDFDVDSVDLRLGSFFFVPRGHRSPFFCPGETDPESLYHEQFVPIGDYLVIPAHNTVLGSTVEFIKLPYDMSGLILTKSSWARTFITIETAPWIHPLYRGCLTLEIANVSNTPIVLYPGVKIAQLVLLHCAGPEPAEDKISDTYVGSVRPERSGIKSPMESLGVFGLERVIHPYDEYKGNL
jgi:dCTP deaminase